MDDDKIILGGDACEDEPQSKSGIDQSFKLKRDLG